LKLAVEFPGKRTKQEKATTALGIDDSKHEAEQTAPAPAATEGTKAKGKWVDKGHPGSVARGIPADKYFSETTAQGAELQFAFRNFSRWCVIVQICLTLRRKWGLQRLHRHSATLFRSCRNRRRGSGARSAGGVI